MPAPPGLREFDDRIAAIRREKESAIDAQDFEKAASLRDKEKTLLAEKAEREKAWKAGDMDVVAEVDDEQIAEVLANWTGIPVFKLTEEETTRLLRMEEELHKRIIGQEEAIKSVSQALRRPRAGTPRPGGGGGSPPRRSSARKRPSRAAARRSGARGRASRTRAVPVARSSSPAPRVSVRPSWPRRWPSSCSVRTTRSSRSTWVSSTTASPCRGWSVPLPATSATTRVASCPRRCGGRRSGRASSAGSGRG